jgi:hypothetical protein
MLWSYLLAVAVAGGLEGARGAACGIGGCMIYCLEFITTLFALMQRPLVRLFIIFIVADGTSKPLGNGIRVCHKKRRSRIRRTLRLSTSAHFHDCHQHRPGMCLHDARFLRRGHMGIWRITCNISAQNRCTVYRISSNSDCVVCCS